MTGEPLTLYLVKQLELAIRARMDVVLKPHGLTTLQFTALTSLRQHDGLSSAQLARRSFVTPQTMNEMVQALESRGYIARKPSPDHGRALLISLTERGSELLGRCAPLVEEIDTTLLGVVPARRRERFRQYLQDCRGSLTAETP